MPHNKASENYVFHVLSIGRSDFCIGCLANAIFLSVLLPIYIFNMASEVGFLLTSFIFGYVILQACLVGASIRTGRNIGTVFSGVVTTIYVFAAHYIVIFAPTKFEISAQILISLIFISSLPQFALYFWKIISSEEFRFPKSKLLIRMAFVHGYLFALLLARHDPIMGIIVIVTSAVLFVAMRTWSSQKVAKVSNICVNPNLRNFKINDDLSLKPVRKGKLEAVMAVSMAKSGNRSLCEQLCILDTCCMCISCCSSMG